MGTTLPLSPGTQSADGQLQPQCKHLQTPPYTTMMMKAAAVVCVVVLASMVSAYDPVTFKDCGSTKGKINSVAIGPSCPKLPCQLKRGTNVTLTMNWTPSEQITAATTTVYGFLNGKIKAPFPLTDNNACHDMTCPAAAGTATVYKHVLPVSTLSPTIPVIVQWQVMVGSDIAACFSIPVVIVA